MFAKESKTAAAYPAFIKKKTKVVAMNRVYSNRMEDSVKTFCWECDQAISLSGLTKHLRGVHKKSVVDYREMYGEPKKQLLRLVHHKCGVCQEDILLDYLVLVKHLRKAHNIRGAATSEYNSKYMDMIQPKIRKLKAKEETPVKEQPAAAFSTPPSTPFAVPKPPSSLPSSSPSSSLTSSSPTPSPTTSPRVAPVPQCTPCARQFKSNMHLKMHLRKEH